MFPLGDVDYTTLISLLLTSLLGGSCVAAWSAFRKSKPEAEAIGMGSLIDVNNELRTEITRLGDVVARQREQIDRQEGRIRDQDDALTRAEARIRALTQELDDLESRRDELGR